MFFVLLFLFVFQFSIVLFFFVFCAFVTFSFFSAEEVSVAAILLPNPKESSESLCTDSHSEVQVKNISISSPADVLPAARAVIE